MEEAQSEEVVRLDAAGGMGWWGFRLFFCRVGGAAMIVVVGQPEDELEAEVGRADEEREGVVKDVVDESGTAAR